MPLSELGVLLSAWTFQIEARPADIRDSWTTGSPTSAPWPSPRTSGLQAGSALRRSSAWSLSIWPGQRLQNLAGSMGSPRAASFDWSVKLASGHAIRGSATVRPLSWLHCTSKDCHRKTLRSSWAEAPVRYGISRVVKVSLGGTRNSWPASHTHDGCRCPERSATAGNDHAGHVSQGIRHQPVVGPLAALLTDEDAGVDQDL